MWNASLGSEGIGTGVARLFPTPGLGVEGMTQTRQKGTFLLAHFYCGIPAAPMGHAQLQEKEPPEGFAGYLTRCRPVPRVGTDRNSKCHLQLSPGSALNRNLGRLPVEDTDFLRRGKSFEIPLFPTPNPRLWLGWGRSPPGTSHCRQSWRKNKPEALNSQILLAAPN